MLAVRLPKDLDEKITTLSKELHRSKSSFVVEALKQYIEDMEDLRDALQVLKDPNRKFYSSSEVDSLINAEAHKSE